MAARRDFIKKSIVCSAGFALAGSQSYASIVNSIIHPTSDSTINLKKSAMKFGLVTYQWGKDWDLPTVISNCEKSGFEAVELRTQHAHGVEISLNALQRAEVKRRFADSSVICVGYGSNFEYHSPDRVILRKNIDQTKEYIKLCKDIGASGIKVKPNTLPADVPREQTISQIANSLNEVGKFAADYGMLVRVEAHGLITQELPNMKAIFDQVTNPNVKICWNSNPVDLNPPGIESNFNLVKQWIGDTVHVRELTQNDYPYQQLFSLLAGTDFHGWILLEASSAPLDRVSAMKEQMATFKNLLANIKVK